MTRCPVTGYACSTAHQHMRCRCDSCRAYSRDKMREWRAKNPDKARSSSRRTTARWRQQNPEAARESVRRWHVHNPERARRKRQESAIKCRYGVPVEAYTQMLAAQQGKCAVCSRAVARLHIDHCHRTGKVRGLLCRACNLGLGNLGDSAERLRLAVAYLEAHTP